MKENTNTWNKSCKESAKKKSELFKMVEAAVMDEKQEQKEWNDQGSAGAASREKGRGG